MLGQLPPRFDICSLADEPEPAAVEPADPDPVSEPVAAEPMSEPDPAEPDPVADPESEPDPVVAEPEPSGVPDPPLSFLHAGPISKQSPSTAVAIRMPRMLPAITAWSLALAIAVQVHAAAAPDVELPPGTRADATGQLVSSRGLRDTTDFIAKRLDRRGIVVKQVGPVRIRGVELTRFLSETPSTPWLAIHVMRTAGKTVIFFVPRPVTKAP